MPLNELTRNEALRLTYQLPRKRIFEFNVEATGAVSTFLVDDDGLSEFLKNRETVTSYGGFSRRREHQQAVELRAGRWHLIVQNVSPSRVTIHYDVSY